MNGWVGGWCVRQNVSIKCRRRVFNELHVVNVNDIGKHIFGGGADDRDALEVSHGSIDRAYYIDIHYSYRYLLLRDLRAHLDGGGGDYNIFGFGPFEAIIGWGSMTLIIF